MAKVMRLNNLRYARVLPMHPRHSITQVRASAYLVETEATAALVALVMKLSEVELRPLFLYLCEWKAAVGGDGPHAALGVLDRRISFYRVLEGLAGALKVTSF